jgi:predicted metal-dependent HD superfamily phosphohydrolase
MMVTVRAVDQEELRKRWEALFDDAPPGVSQDVFEHLWRSYTGVDRHYHGIGHIAECLAELDTVRSLARNPGTIEAAIWFHDVVYDGRRQDNEERSAELADQQLERLGCSPAFREEVRRLILLTRHDRPPADMDGKLMVDIDLASLSRPAEVFDRNSRLIREEYPHVPEADFVRGREQMLGRFLQRPRIYYTDVFHDRDEKQARINLQRVLARTSH